MNNISSVPSDYFCNICQTDLEKNEILEKNECEAELKKQKSENISKVISSLSISLLPCNHYFHKDCIDPWFKECQDSWLNYERWKWKTMACPTCRYVIQPKPEVDPAVPNVENTAILQDLMYNSRFESHQFNDNRFSFIGELGNLRRPRENEERPSRRNLYLDFRLFLLYLLIRSIGNA